MRCCSVLKWLEIVRGSSDDYRQLSHFHYRSGRLGPYSAIFALRAKGRLARRLGKMAVGVIVYTMPLGQLELRNAALGGILSGLDRRTYLWLINKNIRNISRVIIEPRFRGLGLGLFIHWSMDSQLGCVISHSLVGASDDYVHRFIHDLPLYSVCYLSTYVMRVILHCGI